MHTSRYSSPIRRIWEKKVRREELYFGLLSLYTKNPGADVFFLIATKNLGEKLSLWDVFFYETKTDKLNV